MAEAQAHVKAAAMTATQAQAAAMAETQAAAREG